MSKLTIGLIFIFVGLLYGSLIFDVVRSYTTDWLVKNNWVIEPPEKDVKNVEAIQIFGPKTTIFFYSLILIFIGIFIIWNQ